MLIKLENMGEDLRVEDMNIIGAVEEHGNGIGEHDIFFRKLQILMQECHIEELSCRKSHEKAKGEA